MLSSRSISGVDSKYSTVIMCSARSPVGENTDSTCSIVTAGRPG